LSCFFFCVLVSRHHCFPLIALCQDVEHQIHRTNEQSIADRNLRFEWKTVVGQMEAEFRNGRCAQSFSLERGMWTTCCRIAGQFPDDTWGFCAAAHLLSTKTAPSPSRAAKRELDYGIYVDLPSAIVETQSASYAKVQPALAAPLQASTTKPSTYAGGAVPVYTMDLGGGTATGKNGLPLSNSCQPAVLQHACYRYGINDSMTPASVPRVLNRLSDARIDIAFFTYHAHSVVSTGSFCCDSCYASSAFCRDSSLAYVALGASLPASVITIGANRPHCVCCHVFLC
jgi:hypothetical protein